MKERTKAATLNTGKPLFLIDDGNADKVWRIGRAYYPNAMGLCNPFVFTVPIHP